MGRLSRCEAYDLLCFLTLPNMTFSARPYYCWCERLFLCSHLSHITSFLCLLYFRHEKSLWARVWFLDSAKPMTNPLIQNTSRIWMFCCWLLMIFSLSSAVFGWLESLGQRFSHGLAAPCRPSTGPDFSWKHAVREPLLLRVWPYLNGMNHQRWIIWHYLVYVLAL